MSISWLLRTNEIRWFYFSPTGKISHSQVIFLRNGMARENPNELS
uniref:Uncharacterized protein n=1 Tax=Utricularia reniformis TaxID=192314 RepID=A0A1Y0B135_9LAMI|nr:hypothetical protein AEK19_MT0841 [Utricularia reniformis]YP_009382296.1 hypothetical protein AEK19_MT1868 [Utricularia reniformis]ART31073.1 hypothetical protein AEK19_MT0841 [Utricularia reniformis]ART32038.1 hypothetical protein AEK19_MT1868 [Utricularia reniformis]